MLQFFCNGGIPMKKIVLTAILYSRKNYDLSYRLRGLCKRYSINLINAIDFIELTIKCLELKPQIIFCDCSTVEFTSGNLNSFLEKTQFKNTKIIFIDDNNNANALKNIVNQNLILAKFDELTKIIDDLQYQYNYDNILETNIDNYDGLEIQINKLLAEIGLSPKHCGYAYLRYAIKHVVQNNGILNSLNSEQYPIIASIFKTSASNVERNIRNAILQGWKSFGKIYWKDIFFLKSIQEGKKPTNRELIYMCSEIVLAEYNNKKMVAYQ